MSKLRRSDSNCSPNKVYTSFYWSSGEQLGGRPLSGEQLSVLTLPGRPERGEGAGGGGRDMADSIVFTVRVGGPVWL